MNERVKKLFLLEHYKIDEARLALIPFLIFGALVMTQIYRDLSLIQNPVFLTISVGTRIVSVTLAVIVFFAVDQRWGKFTYMILLTCYFVVATGVGAFNFAFRPAEKLFEFLPTMTSIGYIYFLIPSPLWLKTTAALDFTLLCLYRVFTNGNYSGDDLLVIGFSLTFLNLMGIPSAVSMNRLRAKDFENQKKREHEIYFKKAVGDSSFDSTVLVKEGRIVESNRAFQEIFDLDSSRFEGSPLSDYVFIPPKFKSDFESGFKIRGIVYGEFGETPVEMFGRPVVIETETYLCLTMRDVSDEDTSLHVPTEDFNFKLERLPLTKREREIALRILEGKTRFQIGVELFISDETVKKHTTNIYQKLEIRSKIELYNLILSDSKVSPEIL